MKETKTVKEVDGKKILTRKFTREIKVDIEQEIQSIEYQIKELEAKRDELIALSEK